MSAVFGQMSTGRGVQAPTRVGRFLITPVVARLILMAAIAVGASTGVVATAQVATAHAVAAAGPDLTRLLRGMALIKMLIAGLVGAAVLWRLADPVGAFRLAGYAASCAAMAAGPGLIWDMCHVAAGAILLHGGLFAAILLLWRDPATGALLANAVTARTGRRSH